MLLLLGVHVFVLLQTTCIAYPFVTIEKEDVKLQWSWPNSSVEDDYIKNGDYVPEVCMISGVQIDATRRIFLTVPRIFSSKGVPSGLNFLDSSTRRLVAYPNLESNKLGDCNALQLPLSVASDVWMYEVYVIDAGRVAVWSSSEQPLNLCPPKIVVINILKRTIVRRYEFPDNVVSHSTNILNDLVLDYVGPVPAEAKYAYITDSGDNKIVVFDFTTNTSWSFQHRSMAADEDSNITINGQTYHFPTGIDGIAISATFNYVYYSAVGSKKLWQIPTWVLRNKDADFSKYVRLVGKKKSNSGALVAGHRAIYYGALGHSAVYSWEFQKDMQAQGVSEGEVTLKTETLLAQNWEKTQWPGGIAFDNRNRKNLFFISNRAQDFFTGQVDFNGTKGSNMRVCTIPVDDVSSYWDENTLYSSSFSAG